MTLRAAHKNLRLDSSKKLAGKRQPQSKTAATRNTESFNRRAANFRKIDGRAARKNIVCFKTVVITFLYSNRTVYF